MAAYERNGCLQLKEMNDITVYFYNNDDHVLQTNNQTLK